MKRRTLLLAILALAAVEFGAAQVEAASIVIEGAPTDSGFNVGTPAGVRLTVRGLGNAPARYAVFADIQYVGTAAVVSVQLDRAGETKDGSAVYAGDWPVPPDAPTGLYSVLAKVEDRQGGKVVASQKLRGFGVFKKLVRIARVRLDKTFYSEGDPIRCEVVLENQTDAELKGLRVEFSNANYPWISLFRAGEEAANPELALKVLREGLAIPARSETRISMMPAGTAAFTQGQQVAVLGAGGPARHEKVPPPEVDQYTIAVWDSARAVLYDMQFSPQAIVRPPFHGEPVQGEPGMDLPKPYSHNFTHAYLADIDFTKYREFYAPGEVSSVIRLDRSRTLYRAGETVAVKATLSNGARESWRGLALRAEVVDGAGETLREATLARDIELRAGARREVTGDVWTLPSSATPGNYKLRLALEDSGGKAQAATTQEIAVNELPSSLAVFCPHEDDEHAYAGLIRAALEAGIPVRVIVFTGGDVGACERYYSKACGPNEAREFGMVRMEETAAALEHIGLPRDRLTFLGLPDGGSGAIWSTNIKESNPFLSIYLATDHAPYENVLKPNLPFARDAVIEAVKNILKDFRPAMIATPHPDERHVDHRTANWFVIKACQELLREKQIDPGTIILADLAYGSGGFKAAPYRYEKMTVHLSGEAAALKQEMSWIYESQDGNLAEGMRQTFDELPREEVHYRIVDWPEHAGWNE